MFTGIIEELGKIRSISLNGSSGRIAIGAKKVLEGSKIGDSIAVNGVCLTVISLQRDGFIADVMAETVRRSNLGKLHIGDDVNLERAMAADGRFGGHLVSGHIDGTGVIKDYKKEENAVWVTIETEPQILSLIIEKGSVCIDGISLTVENDMIGKYIVQFFHIAKKENSDFMIQAQNSSTDFQRHFKRDSQSESKGLTMEFLKEYL